MPTKKTAKKKAAKVTKPKDFKAYMLRTCAADMTAYGGFKWPKSGEVKALDWKNAAKCGNGLHGLLWGEGDGSLLNWAEDAKWLVCGIDSWVELDGKVKSQRATVIYAGTKEEAVALISHMGGGKYAVVAGIATAGHSGTATAGDDGTATAGDGGTATAGDDGTATAGDRGTATAGDGGTATAGYRGTATAGHSGTATAGYDGTATAGDGGTAAAGHRGTATAGYRGTATAGYDGTATAGDGGTATAGYRGTATAGHSGTILVKWWDGERYRITTGYCGENGIKPNVRYRCDDQGNLIEA